jgi:hypothetical protein
MARTKLKSCLLYVRRLLTAGTLVLLTLLGLGTVFIRDCGHTLASRKFGDDTNATAPFGINDDWFSLSWGNDIGSTGRTIDITRNGWFVAETVWGQRDDHIASESDIEAAYRDQCANDGMLPLAGPRIRFDPDPKYRIQFVRDNFIHDGWPFFRQTVHYWSVYFDLYWLSLVCLILPFLWAVRWIVMAALRQRCRSADLCPNCGYDLRASPVRCPECGLQRVVTNGAARTVS